MSVVNVTKETFDKEVINSDKPVLIDFWAGWCGPCKMLAPVIDEIASETDSLKVCKVNIDNEPELAQRFSVMSIPTLVLMKNGETVGSSVGVRGKAELMEMIRQAM